jgi:hypothetical protein
MNTPDAFDQYDRALNLDPNERLRARVFHNELTTALRLDGLISASFLQGSFARKTMLKPLRDIDKVVILHPDLEHLQSDADGAQSAANIIEAALRRHYPQARVSRSRHSIQLDLGENTFSFDVVPAFELEDDTDDVMIMDLGNDGLSNSWKRSNTRRLIEVVSDRNRLCDGKFVHQVRYVKHWVRTALDEVIPGLHVESIAFQCIDERLDDDIAVERILSCGARLLGPVFEYPDPTGSDQLSKKLDLATREAACYAFVKASEIANEAVTRACAGKYDDANALWYSIFGEPFPRPGAKERSYLRSLGAGAPVSSALAIGPRATRPVRAWRSN